MMKDKIKVTLLITILILIMIFIVVGEIKVQKRWDKYEEKVFIERGIK